MKKLVMFLTVVVMMLAAPSILPATTAGEAAQNCREAIKVLESNDASFDHLSAGWCVGYLMGVQDGSDGMELIVEGKRLTIVFADGVTPAQMARVFIKYMEAHPEKENKSVVVALTAALLESRLVRLIPRAPQSTIQ